MDTTKLLDFIRQQADIRKSSAKLFGSALRDEIDTIAGNIIEAVSDMYSAKTGVAYSLDSDQKRDIGVRYSADSDLAKRAKGQLLLYQDEINKMDVVARITTNSTKKGRKTSDIRKELEETFHTKKGDYTVDHKNIGLVHYDANAISELVKYIYTDAELAAVKISPQVIKRGKQIDHHTEHKGRNNVESFSFAAPVEINGVKGNEVVVVQRTNRNKPHCVRILMPDGTGFNFETIKKADQTGRADASGIRPQPMKSASMDNIADKKGKSNTFTQNSLDTDYLRLAVKYKAGTATEAETQQLQQNVLDAAKTAMPNTKILDKSGNPLLVHHGTKADFTVFNTKEKGGQNGTAEGFGIYLTDSTEVSQAYGDRQIDAYVNITRPAYGFKKTIKKPELVRLLKASCEQQAKQMVEEDEYDSVKEALRDTWVSNYVNTYDQPNMAAAYSAVADSILRQNSNDANVVYEVMNGMGIREYSRAMEFYHDILTPTTGIDGIWQIWTGADGQKSNVYLAFSSEQVKSADLVTYDDAGNIIPLSERFNTANPDIRYSLDTDAIREALSDNDRVRYSLDREAHWRAAAAESKHNRICSMREKRRSLSTSPAVLCFQLNTCACGRLRPSSCASHWASRSAHDDGPRRGRHCGRTCASNA